MDLLELGKCFQLKDTKNRYSQDMTFSDGSMVTTPGIDPDLDPDHRSDPRFHTRGQEFWSINLSSIIMLIILLRRALGPGLI